MTDIDFAVACCEAAMGLVEDPNEITDDELFEGCFECPDNE